MAMMVSGKYKTRVVIHLILIMTIFVSASCYSAPRYQVSDTGERGAPLTQVYFYPRKGQSTEQQARDHYECYNWAINQTHFDPSQSSIPPARRVKVVPMPPPGHDTAVLAVAGAVVGAVSDAQRQQYARELEEAYANRDQALDSNYAGKASDFRRAMSACLEGCGYRVR